MVSFELPTTRRVELRALPHSQFNLELNTHFDDDAAPDSLTCQMLRRLDHEKPKALSPPVSPSGPFIAVGSPH